MITNTIVTRQIQMNSGLNQVEQPGLYYAAGILVPAFTLLLFYLGPGDQLSLLLYSVLFLLTGFGVSSVLLFRQQAGTSPKPYNRIHLFIVISLVWVMMNPLWSLRPDNSFYFGWEYSFFALGFLVISVLTASQWQKIAQLMLLPLAFTALWGVGEFFQTRTRSDGQLMDPNLWAAIYNLAFFFLAALILGGRRSDLVWQIPLLLLFSLAMFSGHSRVATVVHLAALAFLFCTGLWSKASRARVVIICLISISGYLAIDETAEQESINREEGYTLDMEKTGWSERLALWSSALSIYKDHPFLGAGHATFKSLYPAYRQQGDLRTLGNFVHNDYLQLLSEGGPLALVLIVCWVAYLLYWLFRHARAVVFDADAQQSIVAVALILAMGCILAHALMSFILLQASVFFLMAALFARIVMINNHQSLVLPVINHPWLMKGMLFFIALVLWLSLFLDCLSFGMVYQQKGIPYLQTLGEQPDKRVALMKFLKRLRPNTSINHMDLAKIYEASASYQPGRQNQQSLVLMAAQEFELALEANPYSLNVLYFSADLREKHPWLERVKTLQYDLPGLHDHALKVAPSHVITALRKAQYLEARGRYKAAYRQLQAAMPWVDVRHSGFREARLDYLAHLSRLARKNNDRPVIEFVRDKLRWPE